MQLQKNATAWEYVMAQEMALGDAVRQLALLMEERGIPLAFKNEEPWHLLFYRMKEEFEERPAFLDHLRFDVDNRYPRCRELSEFLHGLHMACTARVQNPSYEELVLAPDIKKVWTEARKRLGPGSEEFLKRGLDIASQEFPRKVHA